MNKQLIKCIIILLIALIICLSIAYTIKTTEAKKIQIEEMKILPGQGNVPLYIIGDQHGMADDALYWEEYRIPIEEYHKIKFGEEYDIDIEHPDPHGIVHIIFN